MASRPQPPRVACYPPRFQIHCACLSAQPCCGTLQGEPSSTQPPDLEHAARWWPKASRERPHRQLRKVKGKGRGRRRCRRTQSKAGWKRTQLLPLVHSGTSTWPFLTVKAVAKPKLFGIASPRDWPLRVANQPLGPPARGTRALSEEGAALLSKRAKTAPHAQHW